LPGHSAISKRQILSPLSHGCRVARLVVFDWDGTAVTDREVNARPLRDALLAAAGKGVTFVIVTGTSIEHVARQLAFCEQPPAAGQVYALTNRGSEAYAFDHHGLPMLLWRREATVQELRQLDAIAASVQAQLQAKTGQRIDIIANRLNRRKIDLIPEVAWRNPPKSAIRELLQAVNERFRKAGVEDGLSWALALARQSAAAEGLPQARISTDAKHVEVGLTNKGDALTWVMDHLAPALAVTLPEILVAGDEFGPLGSASGSDAEMCLPEAAGVDFVSVGVEPGGLPPGVAHLPGGPARFLALVREIAARPPGAKPPVLYLPTLVPGWTLAADGYDEAGQLDVEARFALCNGYVGCRGALSEAPPGGRPGTYVAGIFDADEDGHAELVTAPDWRHVKIEIDGEALALDCGEVLLHRLVLDMHCGMFFRFWRHRRADGIITRIHEVRWVSLADVHIFFQAIWVALENHTGTVCVTTTLDGRVRNTLGVAQLAPVERTALPIACLVVRTRHGGQDLALASAAALMGNPVAPVIALEPDRITQTWLSKARPERATELRRMFALFSTRDTNAPTAASRLRAGNLGTDTLESHAAHHVAAWQTRWQEADIEIEGDAQAQQAVRFAIFHLIAAANPADERVSIAARGLTGDGYQGHVFWDTEIYMLPFYTHTCPAAARALLMYRFHTLPAARERARAHGYHGAFYAWESADSGRDETPTSGIGPNGETAPILTGLLEQHVVADIGYAFWRYWLATGDITFMRDAGTEVLIEIARFWCSRATPDESGHYHILDVIGPDEYHDHVNDNAYTNHLARWVIERAVAAVALAQTSFPAAWEQLAASLGYQACEGENWLTIAAALKTGQDPLTGLIEQFDGYFGLDEVDLTTYPSRHIPMCLLLEPAQLQRSKVIKQGDVVSLLHLLDKEFPPAVVRANYQYYEPRTAHDSSLCRSAYGLVAARLGLLDEALRFFRSTAAVDLANDMGNASQGVHMAAQGCLWQLVTHGFMGLTTQNDGVTVNPALPQSWSGLAV
jgi:trehalose/maltose hydrolase-like predicted phosphorylase/hydroxymethylpyrimidine pyrophosphatase-like HAD family hydrolase